RGNTVLCAGSSRGASNWQRRGERFSLSLGERAGVRAGVSDRWINYYCSLLLKRSRFVFGHSISFRGLLARCDEANRYPSWSVPPDVRATFATDPIAH